MFLIFLISLILNYLELQYNGRSRLTLQVSDSFRPEVAIPSLLLQLVLQHHQLLLQLHLAAFQLAALCLHLPEADLQAPSVFLHLRLTLLQPRRRLLLGLKHSVGLLELRTRNGEDKTVHCGLNWVSAAAKLKGLHEGQE